MKFFTPFIIVAISVLLYLMYISPSMAEVQILTLKKAEYANVLAQSKELKDKRDSILAAYNGISEADLARLNKIIPNTFDSVVFANDINALAGRFGLSVKSFQVNQPTADVRAEIVGQSKNQPYQTTAVTLVLTGDYGQFIGFLKELETSLRLVDVAGLAVKTNTQKASGNLEYTVQVYTYSLSASGVSPSAAAATSTDIVGQDILTLVEKLRSISVDPSLFSSNLWGTLKDSGTSLVPEAQGRPNPFAPIGAETFVPPASKTPTKTQ